MENLSKKRIAILATNGFEESELSVPKKALEQAGAHVDIISENEGNIKSWTNGNWGRTYQVDETLDHVTQNNYDALMLPGGVMNPDTLRRNKKAVTFVRSFFENKKPVAAICHAPSLLVEADVLKGRKLTSYSSIKKDIENAGAHWVDKEVVVDDGLVTSRTPNDLPAFNAKLIEEIYEHKQARQMA
jgi:protease I